MRGGTVIDTGIVGFPWLAQELSTMPELMERWIPAAAAG
jgi:hypothetical protein